MSKVKTVFKVSVTKGKLDRIIAAMGVGDQHVDVGIIEGKLGGGQIAQYGFYNEFGTSRIPSRPFMRSSFFLNRRDYLRIMEKGYGQVLAGVISIDRVLKLLGVRGEGDIKKAITKIRSPANAPATIKAKGSSNPLIDDGIMRNAITHEVKKS